MKTKSVIQRALPLNVKYAVDGISYLSIEDGGGCACDNCGKLITNVATVNNGKQTYNIGLDCLDTVLINNNLLDGESYLNYMHSDKPAIQKAKSLRAKILKQQKLNPSFQAELYTPEGKDYFGFSYSIEVTKDCVYNKELRTFVAVVPYNERRPEGFDYTFNAKYKELTLNYIKGLYI